MTESRPTTCLWSKAKGALAAGALDPAGLAQGPRGRPLPRPRPRRAAHPLVGRHRPATTATHAARVLLAKCRRRALHPPGPGRVGRERAQGSWSRPARSSVGSTAPDGRWTQLFCCSWLWLVGAEDLNVNSPTLAALELRRRGSRRAATTCRRDPRRYGRTVRNHGSARVSTIASTCAFPMILHSS